MWRIGPVRRCRACLRHLDLPKKQRVRVRVRVRVSRVQASGLVGIHVQD